MKATSANKPRKATGVRRKRIYVGLTAWHALLRGLLRMNQKRIIKFRVWDDANQKMYHQNNDGVFEIMGQTVWVGARFFGLQAKRFTIEQFTGLYDKNKKEIFEGDIVKSRWRDCGKPDKTDYETCVVEYHNEGEKARFTDFYSINGDNDIQVIGNIHENPELIQK
jgi:uncharacterized phage protein (TIGR01671 family)